MIQETWSINILNQDTSSIDLLYILGHGYFLPTFTGSQLSSYTYLTKPQVNIHRSSIEKKSQLSSYINIWMSVISWQLDFHESSIELLEKSSWQELPCKASIIFDKKELDRSIILIDLLKIVKKKEQGLCKHFCSTMRSWPTDTNHHLDHNNHPFHVNNDMASNGRGQRI